MRRANIFVYDECINQDIDFPQLPVFLCEHYGQCAEDLIVASLLRAWCSRSAVEMSSLQYLEIGGNHPIATSASFLLNRKFGMRGVIIEANPELIVRLQEVRRDDLVLHGAVQAKPVSTVSLSVSNLNELSSLDRSFVLAWRAGEVGERTQITVPALRINEILQAHFANRPPAYLSIDVEGTDLNILEDMDWSRFRPVVVQAEPSDQYIPRNSEQMIAFMANQGYALVGQTDVNLVFMATECLDTIPGDERRVLEDPSQSRNGALSAARSQLNKVRFELSELEKQLTMRDAALRQIQGSRSWRITAPLRVLSRMLGFAS